MQDDLHNSYQQLIGSEDEARRYFISICQSTGENICPRCGSRRYYRLTSGRCRCAVCKYTFHDFTKRWINRGRLAFTKWLKIIYAFAQEWSPQRAARYGEMAYNTVYHSFQTIRYAITAGTVDGFNLLTHHLCIDEPFFRAVSKKTTFEDQIPNVFGIRFANHFVRVEFQPGLSPEAIRSAPLHYERIGAFIITGQFGRFNHLIFHGHDMPGLANHGNNISNGKIDFEWPWAKDRLLIHRGLSANKLPLYLKELEFRFNTAQSALMDQIIKCLCQWDISKFDDDPAKADPDCRAGWSRQGPAKG